MTKRWSGVYPAVLLPFDDEYRIDEPGFRSLLRLGGRARRHSGVVVNGHTGEISSLLPEERVEAVRIAVSEVGDRVRVVSGSAPRGPSRPSSTRRPCRRPVATASC